MWWDGIGSPSTGAEWRGKTLVMRCLFIFDGERVCFFIPHLDDEGTNTNCYSTKINPAQ